LNKSLKHIIQEEIVKVLSEDLPKNKWINASDKELKQYSDEIYQMIKQTYADIGGHPKFKGSSDINRGDVQTWDIEDVDTDPEPDVVLGSKKTNIGIKHQLAASDGTSTAKKELVKQFIKKLKQPGNYVEASHKVADILVANSIPVITDKETVEKILKGKDIKWLGNGYYTRSTKGLSITKRLFGKPKV
jgi:hypothetical protein